eukprot:351815-Chlamydomonas_euryale.AAC.3
MGCGKYTPLFVGRGRKGRWTPPAWRGDPSGAPASLRTPPASTPPSPQPAATAGAAGAAHCGAPRRVRVRCVAVPAGRTLTRCLSLALVRIPSPQVVPQVSAGLHGSASGESGAPARRPSLVDLSS